MVRGALMGQWATIHREMFGGVGVGCTARASRGLKNVGYLLRAIGKKTPCLDPIACR